MSREQTYTATKGTFSLLGGFLKDVAQEIGMVDQYTNRTGSFRR
jgi:hypothetical protein